MYKDMFRLYKRTSFFEGLASFLGLGLKVDRYNYSQNENEADFRAILSDWEHVGQDIKYAISKFERENLDGEHRIQP